MKKCTRLILSLIFIFLALQIYAVEKLPVEFERISSRVLLVKCGYLYTDQVIAIASKKGIVVIDTGKTPSLAVEYRKVIEREFGRNDFIYVINTHYHFDHSNGNQVYPEAEIIAHDLSPEGMSQFEQNLEGFIQGRRDLKEQFQRQLDNAEPGSTQALQANDIVYSLGIMIQDLLGNFKVTYPTITFRDRLTIDLDDLTLRLVHFGEGRHTGDDIIIHCPEEKLLFTGDIFFSRSFQIAYGSQFDVERWIEALNYMLEDRSTVETVFDTHNGRMPGDFIVLWRDYLVDLYEYVKKAKSEGLDMSTVQRELSYEKRFFYISKSDIPSEQLQASHAASLNYMWYNLNDMQSALSVLQPILEESGIETFVQKYRDIKSNSKNEYFFEERDFNQFGYQLLGQKDINGSIEIFKIIIELYPESFNAYDSLGEAYMAGGNTSMAIKNYEKSLELNPENTNAAEMLKKLKKQ